MHRRQVPLLHNLPVCPPNNLSLLRFSNYSDSRKCFMNVMHVQGGCCCGGCQGGERAAGAGGGGCGYCQAGLRVHAQERPYER